MKGNLTTEKLYNKIMQAIRYVQKNDSSFKKSLNSLDPCFQPLIRNFISVSVLGICCETISRMHDFYEFKRKYTDMSEYIGPVQLFKHYQAKDKKIVENMMSSTHESEYLLKTILKYKKTYKNIDVNEKQKKNIQELFKKLNKKKKIFLLKSKIYKLILILN